jgi:hypothetical protein
MPANRGCAIPVPELDGMEIFLINVGTVSPDDAFSKNAGA